MYTLKNETVSLVKRQTVRRASFELNGRCWPAVCLANARRNRTSRSVTATALPLTTILFDVNKAFVHLTTRRTPTTASTSAHWLYRWPVSLFCIITNEPLLIALLKFSMFCICLASRVIYLTFALVHKFSTHFVSIIK